MQARKSCGMAVFHCFRVRQGDKNMILKQSKMLNSAAKSVTAFVEFWSETKSPKSTSWLH
jgi:hypothetical protein